MIQKTLIASRSFQPGAKTTGICVAAFRGTRVRGITQAKRAVTGH
jgi:hypothetical protein